MDLMGGERGTERDGTGGAEGRKGGRGVERDVLWFSKIMYI